MEKKYIYHIAQSLLAAAVLVLSLTSCESLEQVTCRRVMPTQRHLSMPSMPLISNWPPLTCTLST